MTQESKWLKRVTTKFERDERRVERKKRQSAEAAAKDAKLEAEVRQAFEVKRDLLLAEERYARLAPDNRDELPAKPKRVPPADLVGAPWATAGETPAWGRAPLSKVDFSLESFYKGRIYASNTGPAHGAMSHDPRGRSPGKPNEAVYQVEVAGSLKPATIKPSDTWLGRPVVFGWALVDGKAPPWVRATDARLDEMVKADRHLVEACLMKEEEDGTSRADARGTGVTDGLNFEIAR